MEKISGTLYVVATPIGNLEDVTFRALRVLRGVSVIAAEDTRRTRKLLNHYEIHTPLVSCHAHSSRSKRSKLIRRLVEGEDVALVSDAGTPLVSDPGLLLIQEAVDAGVRIVPVPGPSAVLAALTSSGLPCHPFVFLGFPPPKGSRRRRFFEEAARYPMTLVLYEAPGRLLKTLEDIRRIWGDRKVAVARELTKIHEEIFRGTVADALENFREGTLGEVTLVVEGAASVVQTASRQEWMDVLRRCLVDERKSLKDAVELVCRRFGTRRRDVYQAGLEILREKEAFESENSGRDEGS